MTRAAWVDEPQARMERTEKTERTECLDPVTIQTRHAFLTGLLAPSFHFLPSSPPSPSSPSCSFDHPDSAAAKSRRPGHPPPACGRGSSPLVPRCLRVLARCSCARPRARVVSPCAWQWSPPSPGLTPHSL